MRHGTAYGITRTGVPIEAQSYNHSESAIARLTQLPTTGDKPQSNYLNRKPVMAFFFIVSSPTIEVHRTPQFVWYRPGTDSRKSTSHWAYWSEP